jgi:hypothetical protein
MGCDHGRCLARRPELFQQIDSLGRPRRIMHRANTNARPRLARRLWLEGGLCTPDCVTVCDYGLEISDSQVTVLDASQPEPNW